MSRKMSLYNLTGVPPWTLKWFPGVTIAMRQVNDAYIPLNKQTLRKNIK